MFYFYPSIAYLATAVRIVMAHFDSALKWNPQTQTLSGWTEIKGARVFVCVPRELIHSKLPIYNDAVGWEIDRFKNDIVERLIPYMLEKTPT